MTGHRLAVRLWIGAAVLSHTPAPLQAQSILQRVLAALEMSRFPAINYAMMNIAETFGSAPASERRLQPGDAIVIGYDASGFPDLAIADANGLVVTEAQAARQGAGVPPGVYPLGSPLFQLPGGAQLSLFQEDAAGSVLPVAFTDPGRIDASINTILVARIPDLSSGITAITTQATAHVDVQTIASTALGAVNTGDVITSITVDFVAGLDRTQTDIAHAMLAAGFNVTHDMAFASDVAARSTDIRSIGAASNSALLAANIAANMSDIAGSINTHVAGISAQVSGAITTAIGAVNGGTINTSANPDSAQ